MADETDFAPEDRLSDLTLDDSIGRSTPDVEHERAVAIYDLIEENHFAPQRPQPETSPMRSP